MSQRDSGYARKPLDFYPTPEWVTDALRPHLPKLDYIWEPACGSGEMVRALERTGASVLRTDISSGNDFLMFTPPTHERLEAIITNPPYDLAEEFCERALQMMEPARGLVAMLLRTDFDHAKSRAHLFRDCPAFSKKLVLMKRIVWFVEADGKPKASPSFNHAFYIWNWKHEGAPSIAYGP